MAGKSISMKKGVHRHDLDFVDVIHERFICSICTKVMKDPHLMVCCGQKYCNICLQEWLRTKSTPTCPHCRASGSDFQHVIERGMKSEIESFHVLCVNQRVGCEWVGELRNLDKHLTSQDGCAFYEVVCPNKCRSGLKGVTKVQRGKLQDHLTKTCLLRKTTCEFCGKVVTVQDYPVHQTICTMFPMECPNQCGEQGIVRKTVSSHLRSCKFEIIPCTYAHVGCTETMKRQELDEHNTTFQSDHLKKMAMEFDKLKLERQEMQMQMAIELKRQEMQMKMATEFDKLKFERQEMQMKMRVIQADFNAVSLKSCGHEAWFLSMKTQCSDSRNLSDTLLFRMLDFHQIKSGEKSWFSPQFQFMGLKLKLHVKMQDKRLHLDILRTTDSKFPQSLREDSIYISLVKDSRSFAQNMWLMSSQNIFRPRYGMYHNKESQQSRLSTYEFTYTFTDSVEPMYSAISVATTSSTSSMSSAIPVAAAISTSSMSSAIPTSSDEVLHSWFMEPFRERERDYVNNDSLLWYVARVNSHD